MYLGDINVVQQALSGDVPQTQVVTIETDAVTTAKILDGTILAADIATACCNDSKDFRRF
jgi:hypothetical protein